MSEINRTGAQVNPLPAVTQAPAMNRPQGVAPPPDSPKTPAPNQAAFNRVSQGPPANSHLLDPVILEAPLDRASGMEMQMRSSLVPRPLGLQQAEGALAKMSNQELLGMLMQGRNECGAPRFGNILRSAQELESSRILPALRELDARGIAVPASEYNRSISDDAVLVMHGFAKLTSGQIHYLKEQAYKHPEVAPELQGAIDKAYFGSAKHKEFGALVETLSGGVISAEEAMAMCPCGGIPGAGEKEVPLIGGIGAVQRHAMRHDALGFLLTRFDVGPGYGSKTTVLGRQSNDPLAGQVLGLAREVFEDSSVFPASNHVADPKRFA